METIESISVPMYQTASIAERDMRILLAGNYQDMHHHFLAPRTICEWVILLCVGGSGWVQLGKKEKIPVKAGEIILLPPEVPHSYGNAENGWSLLWLHCTGETLHALCEQIYPSEVLPLPASGIIGLFQQLLEKLRTARGFADVLFAESLLTQILCSLVDYVQTSALSSQQTNLIRMAVQYIETTTDYTISLDFLAEKLGISKYYFIRLFRQYTGHTLMEYLQQVRLRRACSLLGNKDYSIGQVSEILGYSTPYHFSSAFKNCFGISPTQYRKLL